MRLSRDKINKLAHVVTDELVVRDDVEFVEDRNTIRLEIVKILNEEMKKEEGLDQVARRKIESQKKWDRSRRQPGVGYSLPKILR